LSVLILIVAIANQGYDKSFGMQTSVIGVVRTDSGDA
jgi:hypothetical protein